MAERRKQTHDRDGSLGVQFPEAALHSLAAIRIGADGTDVPRPSPRGKARGSSGLSSRPSRGARGI